VPLSALLSLALAATGPQHAFEDWARERARAFEQGDRSTSSKTPLWRERNGSGPFLVGFSAPSSLAPLIRAVSPGVLNVLTYSEPVEGIAAGRIPTATGSGFLLGPDGYVVSNHHVVKDAQWIQVRLADGRVFDAELVGSDPDTDLALLRVVDGTDLPSVVLGDSDRLEVGDWVVAIGNPFGLDRSVSHGLISAKERVLGVGPLDDFIQTDALINPGNSGGPLFNMRGEVIGINQQIFSDTKGGGSIGLGFAMPVNDLKFITYQIRDHGRPRIGSVGLRVQALTPNMAGALQLPDASGAIVSEVVPASPAEAAGIKVGDVIMTYDDTKLANHRQFIRVVGEYTIGKKIVLGLWSAGASKTASVQVRELPQELWEDYNSKTVQAPRFTQISDFGMELVEMSPELRKQFDIGAKFNGPVVKEVVTEGAAENANLSAGDVVQTERCRECR
jgi:serine protease Do